MPPTDPKPATEQGRTRVLLIVLGVVAVGALVYAMWPAATPTASPSNPPRDARKPQPTTGAAPGSLEVKLDDLKQAPPGSADTTRNPFRFYVKPPPPPPPRPAPTPALRPKQPGEEGYVEPQPPPPPPITVKCFGVLEKGGTKYAIFSDGKGLPVYAREGQVVFGQYKLLQIGVESVTMSYLDGKGVQRIPVRGGQP